jgi:hypothetical protein
MRKHWITGLVVSLAGGSALTACTDNPYDPDAPAVDPGAPRVHITTPARGTFAGDVAALTVTGTATDDRGIRALQVNGVDAALDAAGHWTAIIPVTAGTQLIHVVAQDADGNVGKESRAVVVGPTRPVATAVPRAITAALSAQTFDAIGHGITGLLRTGDLQAVIAPLNPVLDIDGGPDCAYAQGAITRMSVGGASTVSMTPRRGGLALDIELDQVALGMHLAYALACFDGSTEVAVTASRVKVTGMLEIGVAGGELDIKLVDQRVQLTGLVLDLSGLSGELIRYLHLDTALGPVLGLVAEQLVVPLLNTALAKLNDTRTIDVLGTPVDLTLAPARISFEAAGAVIELDTTLRARGDAASPGYVYVANQPAPAAGRGFQLAVADDAVNQLLGSMWAARGLDLAVDLKTGSYGQIGQLYDRVELATGVPPFVDASGDALRLTLGDLVATFKNGASIATQVAVSAELAVKVVAGPGGAPRLDIGTPTTYVDILDEHVDGANALSNAQFELITSFALARVLAVGSGSVAAIPLPAAGGVAVHDLAIAPATGYLVIDGNVN